ncbi:MAG: 3'-5' exoribonuclease YhaM family protein, partial [Burkholderiales bacterium]
MKDFYIRDCSQHENQTITTTFVVAAKQIKPKKTGDLYIALTLADRTGQIEAKIWDNVHEVLDAFDQDDFVKVKGLLNKYNNRFQLTIHKVRKCEEHEVDFSDYLPKTDKDVESLWRILREFVDSFQNEQLKALLRAFMSDPEIEQRYKNAPAAKSLHHAFVGGLLDHVVSLFKSCDLTARNYPQIDRDLLLAGAFLHDIGKLHELSYSRSISYTTSGQLLGHMIIELEMLHAKIKQVPGFSDELKILLEHMIISHHGHYEFGSPKLPMFPEAL